MEVVFLKNGQKAHLISKTEKWYIVIPFETYQDYETGDEYTEPSGNEQLVDKIYKSAPVEFIEKEYLDLLTKVEKQKSLLTETTKELKQIDSEIRILKTQKTDLSKLIFNRQELRNATRLIVWVSSQIEPKIMDKKNSLKLTISYTITQHSTEERAWVYGSWSDNDDRWSTYSDHIDQLQGIKVDLTDDEILEITYLRQRTIKFDDFNILRCHDKWLTPENIQKKININNTKKTNELENAKQELIKLQDKINTLESSQYVK